MWAAWVGCERPEAGREGGNDLSFGDGGLCGRAAAAREGTSYLNFRGSGVCGREW